MKKLINMKKLPHFTHGSFHLENHNEIAFFSYDYQQDYMLGIFNLENQTEVSVNLKDGIYEDFLNLEKIEVKHGKIKLEQKPIIILTKKGQKT
jgi:cyclomaltodextrinase / maltogenic alpha-amylase / neopullulanase